MNINDKTLHDFGVDLRAALLPLQEKYGVTIKMGTISYTEERFTTKLTVTNGQTPDEAERNAFDADVWKYAHLGLERGMFNRIFLTPDGQRFALRGFNTRSTKYPIIALRISDGVKLRCAEGHVAILTEEYYKTDAPVPTPLEEAGTPPAEAVSTSPDGAGTPPEKMTSPPTAEAVSAPLRATDLMQYETPFERQFRAKMMAAGPGNGEQALRELYRQFKNVGPNDPCPCGSGKKYKKAVGGKTLICLTMMLWLTKHVPAEYLAIIT